MIKSTKKWCIALIFITLAIMLITSLPTIIVDPYFHYHKPLTDVFFYQLNNARSQNHGIIKHFDYNAIITGSSMTQNFKSSELDKLFGVTSIKVPFSGASFKEINDNLKIALNYNPDIKMIVRGLDMNYFFQDKDHMRFDLGEYPTYLYDDNIFNDVNYIFNKSLLTTSCSMLLNSLKNKGVGITDFDTYVNWNAQFDFGKDAIFAIEKIKQFTTPNTIHSLSENDKQILNENVSQNITSLASEYPNTQFYYFFTPYSIAWWGSEYQKGNITRQIESEKYIIELILEHDNIHLFSFNDDFDIITNLDNYRDTVHYGEWINSYILECMKDGSHLLTKDNYLEYLEKEYEFYSTFDYNSIF